MENLELEFGQWLRMERKELGLTQKELADLLEVSGRTVHLWENAIPPNKLTRLGAQVILRRFRKARQVCSGAGKPC